jgi:hypothetical protein
VPSDDEIISAINTALDYADSRNLEATKRKAASVNLLACDADAETNCTSCPNQNGRYKGGLCWYANRASCVHDIKQSCRNELQRYKTDIANFQYRSSQHVITVIKKNNYEGNIICYVNVRTKGTDDVEQQRVTFQMRNGQLIIISNEVVSNKR